MKLFVHIGPSGLLSSGEVFSPFFFFHGGKIIS